MAEGNGFQDSKSNEKYYLQPDYDLFSEVQFASACQTNYEILSFDQIKLSGGLCECVCVCGGYH